MGLFGGNNDKQELDIIEKLVDDVSYLIRHQHPTPPNPHPDWATQFLLTISYNGLKITANKMSISILDTQSVTYKITPVLADGITPSTIAPGSGIVSSSDTTLFTVVPDPTDPSGLSGTITGVPAAVGNGTLNVSGNADPSGTTTVTIVGSDAIGINAPVPPPALAAGFTFSYGAPQAKK